MRFSPTAYVKAIAVASEEPLTEFPSVPTVAETFPGFRGDRWQILVAPIGTPEKIIGKVSEDLRKVVTDPDLKKTIATRGSDTRAMSPAETIAFVRQSNRSGDQCWNASRIRRNDIATMGASFACYRRALNNVGLVESGWRYCTSSNRLGRLSLTVAVPETR